MLCLMLKKIFRPLLWGVLFVLACLRLVADWVGRTTVLDDFELLRQRVKPTIDFIAGQPAAPFYGVLALLAVIGLSLHIPASWWQRHLPRARKLSGPEPSSQEVLPGVTISLAVRFSVQTDKRRKYLVTIIFDNGANASLYVTADNRIVYSITDHYGEVHSVSAKIDAKTVRYGEFFVINGGFGVAPSYSFLSLWKDGVQLESKSIGFPIRVEGISNAARIVWGADANGERAANFDAGGFLWIGRTLSSEEVVLTTEAKMRSITESGMFIQFKEGAHLVSQPPTATEEETPR